MPLHRAMPRSYACIPQHSAQALSRSRRHSSRMPESNLSDLPRGSIDDIRRVAAAGVQGVVVGKAIYEGRITLEELSDLQRELL